MGRKGPKIINEGEIVICIEVIIEKQIEIQDKARIHIPYDVRRTLKELTQELLKYEDKILENKVYIKIGNISKISEGKNIDGNLSMQNVWR